jgi:uncharacterized low-complexity protein
MKTLKVVVAAAFIAAAGLAGSSVGSLGSAEAKAHVTKGKPGKCGATKYYSKKDKGCVSKT